MLLQFTVGNYRSFRDRVTFSMMAAPADVGHESSLLPLGAMPPQDRVAVSLAATFGANASGKSNLFRAIDFMRRQVVHGNRSGRPIPVDRFLLDSNDEPSYFEMVFEVPPRPGAPARIFTYGIECSVHTIYREWLYEGLDDRPLFQRDTTDYKVSVKTSSDLRKLSGVIDQRWEFIASGTRPNQPFLWQAIDQNVRILMDIGFWFRERLLVIWPDSRDHRALVRMDYDDSDVTALGDFLRAADTGIVKVELLDEPFDLALLSDRSRREVEASLFEDGQSHATVRVYGEPVTIKADPTTNTIRQLRLLATHRGPNGTLRQMEWSTESDGTKWLAELWQMIFMHRSTDMTLCIDEIERSLHPELMRFLIVQWRDAPRAKSQLIFSTHNDNFLEDDLLRRDEVWFVEKDVSGRTRMLSEAEFVPIDGVTRQRAYLDGMYGATPRISDRRFYWFRTGSWSTDNVTATAVSAS